MEINIGIDRDFNTEKTTLKLRRKCGDALRYFSNEFNYIEFRGLGVGRYQFRKYEGVSMDDFLFIVEFAVKNTPEFKALINSHSDENRVIRLAKIRPETCFFTGEITRDYRKSGENTYYQLDGELIKLKSEIVSRSITQSMLKCLDCGKYVIEYNQAMNHNQHGKICFECEQNYLDCETCGEMSLNEDCVHCERFYSQLHDYETKAPRFLFFDWIKGKFTRSKIESQGNNKREKALYIGDEHEVECVESDDKYELVTTLSKFYSNLLFYFTRDSSLNSGVEIHSHPMTHKAHKQRKWGGFEEIREWGVRSYDTETAGLHFHLNRSAFTNFHFLKFVKFINENIGFTLGIARRKDMGNLNNYSPFYYRTPHDIKRYMARRYREFSGNREMVCNVGSRGAINLANQKTVELRFFGGSLEEVKYKAKIDFVQAVYEYTQDSSYTHQGVKEFTEYVNSNNKFGALQKEFDTDNFKRVIEFPKSQPNNLNY